MISFVIKVRSQLNIKKLSVYISRFLKSTKSRYVSVQLLFYTAENKIAPIGNKYLLDLHNEQEVKTYKFYIQQYYIYNYSNDEPVNKVVFNYIDADKNNI